MISFQNYVCPQTAQEAWTLYQQKGSCLLGGMQWLKMSSASYRTAIDLSGLGLCGIEETEDAFRIGCMTTLRQLETHPGLHTYTGGAAQEAVRHIVGVQFRNTATVGGSIAGRFGFSDVLTLLLAADCSVELFQGGILPLAEYVERKPDRDILLRVILHKEKARFCYQSVRNSATDFPVLACAAKVTVDGQWCFVYGARPQKAVRLSDDTGILREVTPESAEAFARYAAQNVSTGTNLRGSAEYRTRLVEVLTGRAVRRLAGLSPEVSDREPAGVDSGGNAQANQTVSGGFPLHTSAGQEDAGNAQANETASGGFPLHMSAGQEDAGNVQTAGEGKTAGASDSQTGKEACTWS